jgi:hypothetical protein
MEEAAFKDCSGLEGCVVAENAKLQRIEKEVFSGCSSLRSFDIPLNIELIGENCFQKCHSLRRLGFASRDSLKRLVGDSMLDEVLETFGLDEISGLFRIEIDDGGVSFDFPGWSFVADGLSRPALVPDIR